MYLIDRLFFLILPRCMALLTAIQDYALIRRQVDLARTPRCSGAANPPKADPAKVLAFVKPATPLTFSRTVVLGGRQAIKQNVSSAFQRFGQPYRLEDCEDSDVRVGCCSIVSISQAYRQARQGESR